MNTITSLLTFRTLPSFPKRHLRAMQRELSHSCNAIPELSRFDIEPEFSEAPTNDKQCFRCGKVGHIARNCCGMYLVKKLLASPHRP